MQDERELRRIQEDLTYERQRAAEAIDQLDRLREKAQREQEERRRERMRSYEQALRQVDGWRSALITQEMLCRRETDLDEETGGFFQESADACERAIRLWDAESARIQPQIEALQRQIEDLQRQIRRTVGERLAQESADREGWESVALALAGDEFEDPSEWLNW